MGQKIDLLANYPKSNRNIKKRGASKSEHDREIARKFGKEFFDGDRRHGYGGYYYDPRFWQPVIPTFQRHFELNPDSLILDVGCGKGFMLYDFTIVIPGIRVKGIDISEYAIMNAVEEMKTHLCIANAKELPFDDDSFDLVISINTVHNLKRDDCAKALCEIERVSRGKSFISVDAYRNEEEKDLMYAWNLTARTVMHEKEWISFFSEIGYTGDYYWFIP